MAEISKGSRVQITGGKSGAGNAGIVFWWGESKYGDGMRAGVKDDNDETFWVDAEDLELLEGEAAVATEKSNEPKPPPANASDFSTGDRVNVVKGKEEGTSGEIFWWGASKYGDGMRAGITTDSGDKVWAAGFELERVDGGESRASVGEKTSTQKPSTSFEEFPESYAPSSSEPPVSEDIPLPDEPPPGHPDLMTPEERVDMEQGD